MASSSDKPGTIKKQMRTFVQRMPGFLTPTSRINTGDKTHVASLAKVRPWENHLEQRWDGVHNLNNLLGREDRGGPLLHMPSPGHPKPPDNAMGSHYFMSWWHWMHMHQTRAQFKPERFVVMIMGRPMCQVIMTHNHIPLWEKTQHASKDLKPLPALNLKGPTGGTTQGLKTRWHSQSNWFKDIVFVG
jgi:hypothetical protein